MPKQYLTPAAAQDQGYTDLMYRPSRVDYALYWKADYIGSWYNPERLGLTLESTASKLKFRQPL